MRASYCMGIKIQTQHTHTQKKHELMKEVYTKTLVLCTFFISPCFWYVLFKCFYRRLPCLHLAKGLIRPRNGNNLWRGLLVLFYLTVDRSRRWEPSRPIQCRENITWLR